MELRAKRHCGIDAGSLSAILLMSMLAGCAQQMTAPPKPTPVVTASEPALLQSDQLRTDHPNSYTVMPGDSEWDISAKFLKDPWKWRGLWPQTDGALYAGDTIQLNDQQEAPQLQRVAGQRATIKLSPQVRVELIDQPIPTVNSDAVTPFIENGVVLDRADWEAAPYVLADPDEGLIPTTGSQVFVRGATLDLPRYKIYRINKEYIDPQGGEKLGYGMVFVADAEVITDSDPGIVQISNSERGVRAGDRLIALADDTGQSALNFELHPVPIDTEGQIIDSLDNVLAISRYSNVAVNLGAYDGMRPGHVLAVYKPRRMIRDTLTGEQVEIPRKRVGLIMLYKIFDLVSYGLVTESERDIRVADRVAEP